MGGLQALQAEPRIHCRIGPFAHPEVATSKQVTNSNEKFFFI
jgi:hypothetical protein